MAGSNRFSPSKGWDQTRLWLEQHRTYFVPIAGAFFMLPILVVAFLGPDIVLPALDPETTDPDVWQAEVYAAIAPLVPWILAMALVMCVGQLAIVAIAVEERGIGVGEAVKLGFVALGFYLLAQLLINIAANIVSFAIGFVLLALGPLAFVLNLAFLVAFIWISMRLTLLAPALMGDGAKWPWPMIRRSWGLTAGNAGRIFLFYLLIGIVAFILLVVASLVLGLLGLMLGEIGVALSTVGLSAIAAGALTVYSLLPVAIWRQLAGSRATPQVFS